MFPAASLARMVTVLFPTRTRTWADQAVVPLATPVVPKLVLQETCLTPTLSFSVPIRVTEVAVVDMLPVEGDVIVRVGAVVSGLAGVLVSRTMVTAFET